MNFLFSGSSLSLKTKYAIAATSVEAAQKAGSPISVTKYHELENSESMRINYELWIRD